MPDGNQTPPQMVTPDFDYYPSEPRLIAAKPDTRSVRVTWSDGVEARFHVMSLREGSPDADTTHPVTREQQLYLLDIPADLEAVEASVTEDGGMSVLWSSGDRSRYHQGWLRAYAPGGDTSTELPKQIFWNASMDEAPPRIAMSGPEDEAAFEAWCEAIHVYGAAILEGTPATPETIETFPAKIGPVRESNFGLYFDVFSKPDADSNAYTTMDLPPHVDLATREYQPGLQFLHAIANEANGGDSIVVDAFALAHKLRDLDPDAYDALSTVPIRQQNKAKETDYRQFAPLFRVDVTGAIIEARWNPWLRGPSNASFEDTERLYRGLYLAFNMAESEEFRKVVRLKAGDLLGFDNRRILHGRTGYDPATGARHLRGCYIEREELQSRLRIFGRAKRRALYS